MFLFYMLLIVFDDVLNNISYFYLNGEIDGINLVHDMTGNELIRTSHLITHALINGSVITRLLEWAIDMHWCNCMVGIPIHVVLVMSRAS